MTWFNDIRAKARLPHTDALIPCTLLCNKIDLKEVKAKHSIELEKGFIHKGFFQVFGSSALTGENLVPALENLLRQAVKHIEASQKQHDTAKIQNLNIQQDKGCC